MTIFDVQSHNLHCIKFQEINHMLWCKNLEKSAMAWILGANPEPVHMKTVQFDYGIGKRLLVDLRERRGLSVRASGARRFSNCSEHGSEAVWQAA